MITEKLRVVMTKESALFNPCEEALQASVDITVVGVARDDKELRRLIVRLTPDVIVVTMPLITNFPALIAHLGHTGRQTRCVIARQGEDATLMALYLKQGAVGYTFQDDGADCPVIVRRAKARAAWIDADVASAIHASLCQIATQRRQSHLLPTYEQLILEHLILGETSTMIATHNPAWSEASVLALLYNLLYHYQNI